MITCKKHTPFQTLLAVRTFFGLMVGGALSAFAVAPSITVGPERQSVEAGGTLTLSATASDALGYQWWKDGVALAGATNATLSVADARVTDTGVYTLAATNADGMAISLPVDVTVGDSCLMAWGFNSSGQLGDGSDASADRPVLAASEVVTAAAGNDHSLFVRTDGTLWAMGGNACGQLGNGTASGTNRPVQVAGDAVTAAAGWAFSLFIKTDGTLWAMGDNSCGQLGLGATGTVLLPTFVASNVVSVSAGGMHTLFVKSDGTLWAMGAMGEYNDSGQLGIGVAGGTNVPVRVADGVACAEAGGWHSLFVKADGTLWGMGWNLFGQFGDGTNADSDHPIQVASGVRAATSGHYHSLFVKEDGTLWAMGCNLEGEFGSGTATETNLPVYVTGDAANAAGGGTHSLFTKTDGTLWTVGDDLSGQHGDGEAASDFGIPTRPLCGPAVPAKGPEAYHVLAIGTPLAAVTVSTPVGTADPASGIYFASLNSVFTNAMNTPVVTSGTTQYVCLGWAATGATPDSGSGTTAIVTLTNATASLSWLWQTNYWFDLSSGAGGAVSPTSAWFNAGVTLQATAAADDGCIFSRWSGDASGSANPLSVTMDRARTITALFLRPPSITGQPVGQSVGKGGTVTLSATVIRALGYQWWKDGAALACETNATLTVADAEAPDTGMYTLVATNADGTAVSLPTSVAVGAPALQAWGSNGDGQFGNGIANAINTLPVPVVFDAVTAAAGGWHSLFVKADGTLWAMGGNSYGQLGIGTTESTNLPVFVASHVLVAAASRYHSLFVKADGTLWAMGYNGYGELGDGTKTSVNVPIRVASNVVAIAAGYYHSLFVKTDGTLWAMGDNGGGELGDGTTTSTNLPIRVASNVVAVAAGYYHSLFVKADGTLWGMGYNYYGQLGDGSTTARKTPVLIAGDVVSAAAGYNHTLFVKADGTLWAMGQNDHGQLGVGTTANTNRPVCAASGVVSAAAGNAHSLFTKTDGTVWAMGYNNNGQLGNGTTTETHAPTQVSCGHPASVRSGANASHVLMVGVPLAAVTVSSPVGATDPAPGTYTVDLDSVLTNALSSPVVTSGATQYVCTGWAMTGGSPASGDGTRAVVTVTNATAVLSWLWQTNYWFDLSAGAGGSVSPASAWVNAGAVLQATATADDGYVFVKWSGDASGSDNPLSVTVDRAKTIAARFATPPTITAQPVGQVLAEGGTLALSVSASDATGYQWWKDGARLIGATDATLTVAGATVRDSGVYTVVITNADALVISVPVDVAVGSPALLAWGYNTYGQLGLGTKTSMNRPVRVMSDAVTAAAGYCHSLAIRSDGTLWAMGDNDYGQLGDGTATDTNRPVQVASDVVAAAAGYYHSLFIQSDGTLWAMGGNAYGQLGDGTTTAANRPICVASNVAAAAAGCYHSLFVKTDGTLWGMGCGDHYQLGLGTNAATNALPIRLAGDVTAVSAGYYHSLFVKTDGTLWGMGYNNYGQLGRGATAMEKTPVLVASNVVAAAAGDDHSLFVKTDGTLWAMGLNDYGQLGDGSTSNTNLPIHVADDVASAAAGRGFSLFAKTDGSFQGMGWNRFGQLGVGSSEENVSAQTRVLCDHGALIARGASAFHALAIGWPQAAVTVSTPVGTVDPAAGIYSVSLNSVFTNVMTTPVVTSGTTQYVCTGWAMTGGTPASGGGTTAIVTVTNDTATLTWNWQIRYRLDTSSGSGGSVSPASVWVDAGTTTQLVATADVGYRFKTWSGDASGSDNPLDVLMDRSKTITALFLVPPSITVQPTNQCVDKDGAFSLSVTASNALGYQWWKDGAKLIGATNATLTVTRAEMKDNGVYSVVIANADAVAISIPADVAVGNPSLLAWGYNAYGQFGDGTTKSVDRPLRVATGAVTAAAGGGHSLFIQSDGTLWAMGRNDSGQLGDGTATVANRPVFVASNTVTAAAGYDHSLFIQSDGTLWGMGYNNYGQLGRGATGSEESPVQIAEDVLSAAAGNNHSLFVKTDGTLWVMGMNDCGQLGNGTTTRADLPIHLADDVAAAGAGMSFSLFSKTDGTVWAMGFDRLGQLGIGLKTEEAVSSPTRVLCESTATIARGASASHTLAIGTPLAAVTVSTPVGTADPAAGIYSVSLNSVFTNAMTTPVVTSGTTQYVCTGWAMTGATPASGSGTTAIATVIDDTAMLSWLWRTNYLLTATAGAGGSVAPTTAWVEAGATTQLVATADAGYRLKAWIGDAAGIANPLSVTMDRAKTIAARFVLPPTITAQPAHQTVVAVGGTLTLSVTASDTLGYQWWKNGVRLAGETGATLSLAHATARDSGVYSVVVTNADLIAVSLPADVAVGNPALYAWGYGGYGQFGNGVCDYCRGTHPTPALAMSGVLTAAAGWYHSLFVKTDGTLWAAGDNLYGQLGDGTTEHDCQPVRVAEDVLTVAAGYQHSLFLKTDGTLWDMGRNDYGQLGNGALDRINSTPVCVASNVVAASGGYYHSLFIQADGTLWAMGLGSDMTTRNTRPVWVADGVVSATAGGWHSLFVKADGTLWTMGKNDYGQLGDGTNVTRTVPFLVTNDVTCASAGERHSLFVRTDGTLWAMGLNAYGQLGVGTAEGTNSTPLYVDSGVVSAVGGQYFSLYLKTDGTVRAMGDNGYGQLGDGTTTSSLSPIQTLCDPAAAVITGPTAWHGFAVESSAAGAVLTVSTPVGTTDPVAGGYAVEMDDVFTSTMTTPVVTDGPTQVVCTGWSAIGATPNGGSGTEAVVTVTDTTAVVTWLWTTNYLLTATAGTGGSAAPASVWVAGGATTQLTATAEEGYVFDAWSGDASGSDNPLSVLMDSPKSIVAAFRVAAYTTGDHPTPIQWIRQYGIAGFGSDVENADPDGDGLAVWAEYVAGTDPTNQFSRLVITHCAEMCTTVLNGETKGFAITWPSVTGRVYSVRYCTNLMENAWTVLPDAVGLSGQSVSMTVTDLVVSAASSNCFFKVEVNLPQE